MLDNYKAAFDATVHLIEKGYKRVGMINDASAPFHLQERSRGCQMALIENSISLDSDYLQLTNAAAIKEDTEKSVRNLLAGPAPPEA